MGRLWVVVRLLLFVFVFVFRRAVRRALRGPAVPTWTWAMELKVSMMRGFILGAMRYTDREGRQRLEAMIDPPVPRRLRGLVSVRRVELGGVVAEEVMRRGELADLGTLLYLHGGAYVAGSPATHRGLTADLTWECRVRTLVPAYRLAPQHPFPAAVDDAERAYRAVLDQGVDPRQLVIGGDSAGGGLALALMFRVREAGLPMPAGAVLFSPYTDLTHSGASIRRNVETDYLPDRRTTSADEYLGGADPRTPEASPLFGDLAGLPPVLVFAGRREMILDDSRRLIERARSAGADFSLHLEEDMFHVWPAVLPHHPATRRTIAMTAEFIASRTAAVRPGG